MKVLLDTVRKVKFLSNFFIVKSKLSTAKKSKTRTFSRVFHPKFFLGQKMKISNSMTNDANRGQNIKMLSFGNLTFVKNLSKNFERFGVKPKTILKYKSRVSQLKSLQTRFSSETRSRLSSHCRQDFHDKTLWEE